MAAEYDVGVVGAGIIGLAHAYHLARRGLKVIVFERSARAQGASIRNFGMVWPTGQPDGMMFEMAKCSRQHWLEVLRSGGFWFRECGSLHLAYHEDEEQVLNEFASQCSDGSRSCEILTAKQIANQFPSIVQDKLRSGLWSGSEIAVDSRQVIAGLPSWLAKTYGVKFEFDTTVLDYQLPNIKTTNGEFHTKRLVICTGADFRDLAPQEFKDSGLIACKLQMMKSQPYGDQFQIGTHLAAGLTLRHYSSFKNCPTLPVLSKRLEKEFPEYGQYGIHVMVSQNSLGEFIIGDSHEYGNAIEPFDNPKIDQLILDYLQRFVKIPDLSIASRWNGIYVKHPQKSFVIAHPSPDVVAVTGLGGAGMTLSFGLAEHVLNSW